MKEDENGEDTQPLHEHHWVWEYTDDRGIAHYRCACGATK